MTEKQAIRRFEAHLEDLDRRMLGMEAELEQVDPGLRASYRNELAALTADRRAAQEKLAHLRLADAESWQEEDLEAGILEIFDEIGERLDRLFFRVREKT
jgi:hypothetical protein